MDSLPTVKDSADKHAGGRFRVRAADIVDLFAYTMVLGLFVEFFPAVISETFLLILLTAILLKLVLELVVWIKGRLLHRIRIATGTWRRVVNIVTLLLVLPGSKFLVIELTALVFRGQVHLGGFFQVTILIVILMLTRGLIRRLINEQ
ncbi:hypothetical protein HII28_18180 [Planctomonas sp. JC2975]|uniref:hypothetical protein n=1 Tax=Planctomonas sp. JC2975 TaxID=2729626 RepID=UPI001475D62C|nr:hypothetical protein [Planctomonas sp. JC2975]NNC13793.1 hypothetical protein [Planctomonas sp. JC2975]